MAPIRNVQARSTAVLATGFLAGLIAYPMLPGPFLDQERFARVMVAFTLPATALVIHTLFRSLWTHDRIRSGNGAFEATYQAIVFRVLLFVVALHVLVMVALTGPFHAIGARMSLRTSGGHPPAWCYRDRQPAARTR
jgi:hypothetical protein